MTTPRICCIDGNIGTGKSTVLNKLKDEGYLVFEEDLSNWGTLLDFFYQDPKRWMCTLQIKILTSMRSQYERMRAHKGDTYVFVERSPISSMIFIENGVKNGCLTKDEETLIHDIYDRLAWKPDISFYINTDVDTCFARMRTRNRECERDVDISYLQFLHEGYIKTYESEPMRDSSYIIDGLTPIDKVVKQIIDKL
jgi:deoxyadenosine/deoxycytidine kinase